MDITITINLDNAAFHEGGDPGPEVARILEALAARLEGSIAIEPGQSQNLRDINGNKCGYFEVK